MKPDLHRTCSSVHVITLGGSTHKIGGSTHKNARGAVSNVVRYTSCQPTSMHEGNVCTGTPVWIVESASFSHRKVNVDLYTNSTFCMLFQTGT